MSALILRSMKQQTGAPVAHGTSDCFSVIEGAVGIARPAAFRGSRDTWRPASTRKGVMAQLRRYLNQFSDVRPAGEALCPGDICIVACGDAADDVEFAFVDSAYLLRVRRGRGWAPYRKSEVLEVRRCRMC